jgi:hypothetical protein
MLQREPLHERVFVVNLVAEESHAAAFREPLA